MAAQFAVFGARVRTQDPVAGAADAVAWSDGRIVGVGDAADVRDLCDGTTQVIDGTGLTVTPGLVDGHQHLFHGAETGQGVNFDRVSSLAELRRLIRAERERLGAGAWIQGFAVEYAAFEGARYHHSLLDEAAGDGPMFLISLDVHTAFVNAHALRVAGVTGPVDFGAGAIVACDENGPTGELNEMPAMRLVMDHVPVAGVAQRRQWYREAIEAQNRVGITAIHQMDGSLQTLDDLAALEDEGHLGLRVLLHHFVYPTTGDDEVAEIVAARGRAGRQWQADGVKFMLDGVIDTGTAWLEEQDTHGDGLEPYWPDLEHYHRRIRLFHDAGFRIATHAIGDRAVREVLDTYAGLPGRDGLRHRIEHIEAAPDELVARFRAEGVTASVQPIHVRWLSPDLSDPWSQRLGPHRCRRAFRSGDLAGTGALVVLGSDWPVAPFDPRLGFFAAQQRRAPDVEDPRPVGESRPLTAEEVLAGFTRNAAIAVGETDSGVLRPGARADLAVWADDPVECPAGDVVDLPVVLTVADGRIVHRSDSVS
jgi:predicted amidohydrolase YtcJ